MQKNKNSRLWASLSILFDITVFLVCTATAALCIHLFQLDLYQTLSRHNEEPVGTITYKHKAVQRRFIDRLLWDRLQRESPVYEGDFIRTEDLSEATIFFTGGGIVNLAENSLIQIFGQQLRVSEGEVGVDAQERGLVITSGDSTIVLDSGGVLSARADSEGQLGLWVSEGRATINTSGAVHEAQAGSAVSFNRDGSMGDMPLTAVLSPRPGARFVSPHEEGAPVEFAFRPVNYNDGEVTRLEIASSRDFDEIILRQDLRDNRLSALLRPGVWWWRAYPVKAGEEGVPASAAAGRLAVIRSAPPVLLTPADGEVFAYRTNNPSVHYRWNLGAGANEVQYSLLEVADNPQMANPVLRAQLRGAQTVNSQLGEGRWYWRLSPGFPPEYQGSAAPSRVFSFVIEQHDELPAPALVAPSPQSVINLARNREDIWFSWRQTAGLDSYTLRISENPDLSRPVISAALQTNYYIYSAQNTALREGQYYWGVFGTGGGMDSRLSPVWSFTASPPLAAIFPPDNQSVQEEAVAELRFAWGGAIRARRIQISRDADFSSLVVDEAVTGEAHRIQGLPPGDWYWRVVADNEESPARRLNIAAAVPAPVAAVTPTPAPAPAVVEAPRHFEPSERHVFDASYLRSNSHIDFSWPASPAAGGYTLSVRRADGTRLVNVRVSGASYRLQDLGTLSRGHFIWEVRAGDRIIGEHHFYLRFPEVQKIRLRDLGTVFSVQQQGDSEGRIQRLSWFRDENASRYELIVERQENGGFREIYRGTSQESSGDVPVTRGAFRFRVRIYNLLGQLEHETNWAAFNIIMAAQ